MNSPSQKVTRETVVAANARIVARADSTVTDAMVEAGVRVLRESGFLRYESSADSLVVRELLEKALAVRKN